MGGVKTLTYTEIKALYYVTIFARDLIRQLADNSIRVFPGSSFHNSDWSLILLTIRIFLSD